jgi:hypothetical protein
VVGRPVVPVMWSQMVKPDGHFGSVLGCGHQVAAGPEMR